MAFSELAVDQNIFCIVANELKIFPENTFSESSFITFVAHAFINVMHIFKLDKIRETFCSRTLKHV